MELGATTHPQLGQATLRSSMSLWQHGHLVTPGGWIAEAASEVSTCVVRGVRQWRQTWALERIHSPQAGQSLRSESGRALSRSLPQYRQTTASSWMSSAQYGHFFTVGSHFEVPPLPL
jgi:hypothetical protein